MKNRILFALMIALAVGGLYAQESTTDIARLVGELGAHADLDLMRDLQDPTLLPASGIHEPLLIWNVSPASPRGALALIVPPAVRVGRTLLDLQAQGVQFTDSFTVRRLLNATEMWNQFAAGPSYQSSWKVAAEAMDRDELRPNEVVTVTDATALTRFQVSEVSGPVTNSLPPGGPEPGVCWCCLSFKVYSIPGGFTCIDPGSQCEICAPCGPGRPPVWPGPPPGNQNFDLQLH